MSRFIPLSIPNFEGNERKYVDDAIDQEMCIRDRANADTNGRIINELIDKFVTCNRERACAFYSLGQKRYLLSLIHILSHG